MTFSAPRLASCDRVATRGIARRVFEVVAPVGPDRLLSPDVPDVPGFSPSFRGERTERDEGEMKVRVLGEWGSVAFRV